MSRTNSIVIRPARAADAADLRRLAELDSASDLGGTALLAEVDGRIVAALDVDSGAHVADPFQPTADVVALLELRAHNGRRRVRPPRHRFAMPHLRPRARAA